MNILDAGVAEFIDYHLAQQSLNDEIQIYGSW